MQSYLYSLAFLLILVECARTTIFTADVDPSLSRHPRDVNSAAVLTPLSLNVSSQISSRFANTLVTSTLVNRSPHNVEAKFVVQLPETAFISNFSMVVNGKHYIGKVKEKNAAKNEFEKAKNENRSTGLVSSTESEQALRGMDVFTIAISVAPNSSAEFRLNYQQLLVRRRGYYEQAISIRPKQIVPVLKVVVDIEEPQALSYVDVMKIRENPSDAVVKGNPLATVTKVSPTSVHIEYNPSEDEQGPTGVHGDFIIRYDVAHGNDAGIIQVLGSHFVQYFSPSGLNPLAKNVVFVIDVSGSMSGQKIAQTRQAMFAILDQLRAGDSFNIVLFNGDTLLWRSSASFATSENIKLGKVFVDKNVIAGGTTNINSALLLALKRLTNTANQQNGNFPMVLFLTDGDPTAGVTNTKTIRTNVYNANGIKASIFALGFGFDMNFDFLTALSTENGGNSRRIYPDKDATSQLEGFFDEISTPLLLRVRFEYPRDIVDDTRVTASQFSQYYEGSELVVSGKIKEGVSSRLMDVNVRGISSNNADVTYTVSRTLQNLTIPSNKVLIDDFTERLWAYMKIKQLLLKLLVTDDSKEQARLKSEALQMSLQYNFVTPLTSFVVVQSASYEEGKDLVLGIGAVTPKANDMFNSVSSLAGWRMMSSGLLVLSTFFTFV